MTPERHWEGEEDANGGYIVVKQDGSVVCYHIYNRTDFEQYLYDYTCLTVRVLHVMNTLRYTMKTMFIK